MQKIKRAFDADAYGDEIFLGLSSAMVACFLAGGILRSFSWGALAGLITLAVGLVLGMCVWTLFFARNSY